MGRLDRADAGETLVEILIAIVIMGLALAALMTGLLGASRATAAHREQARANGYLTTASEILKSSSYIGTCTPTAGYQSRLSSVLPADWTSAGGTLAVSVEFWDPTKAPSTDTFGGTCLESATTFAVASATTSAGFSTITVGAGAAVTTGMIGQQVRLTCGTAGGDREPIKDVDVSARTLTTAAFPTNPAAGTSICVEQADFQRAQRVTVTATTPDGGRDSLSVVKRYLG
jgi:type II secretory pathway pseudopilin PulG